jgi:hypothetical protein
VLNPAAMTSSTRPGRRDVVVDHEGGEAVALQRDRPVTARSTSCSNTRLRSSGSSSRGAWARSAQQPRWARQRGEEPVSASPRRPPRPPGTIRSRRPTTGHPRPPSRPIHYLNRIVEPRVRLLCEGATRGQGRNGGQRGTADGHRGCAVWTWPRHGLSTPGRAQLRVRRHPPAVRAHPARLRVYAPHPTPCARSSPRPRPRHATAAAIMRAVNGGDVETALALVDDGHAQLREDRETLVRGRPRGARPSRVSATPAPAVPDGLLVGSLARSLGVRRRRCASGSAPASSRPTATRARATASTRPPTCATRAWCTSCAAAGTCSPRSPR